MADFENEAIFQKNRLPARSYFREKASISLNGRWDFQCSSCPSEAPPIAECWNQANDWDKIDVPGHWQLQGYGHPHYTNVQFPFPVEPPYTPSQNPTGTYHTRFVLPASYEEGGDVRIRFLGVDSAFHIFLNGVEVGYHQGSRNVAEFDITKLAIPGTSNSLLVRVYKWCDGSYIEDQDQWWLSGIFRDVDVLCFPVDGHIEDCQLETSFESENYTDATLHFNLKVQISKRLKLTLKLYDDTDKLVCSIYDNHISYLEVSGSQFMPNPIKWTAEDPYLYRLEIQLTDDIKVVHAVSQKVGFRQVEMKNGNLCVNGRPILFRGVNRHDHHPRHGRAVPHDYMKQDLLLMKRNNVNALRTSHYPPDPTLLDLCDELGFWVIDEADLECHGFFEAIARTAEIDQSNYFERLGEFEPRAAAFTSDNEKWRGAYLDRMECLVQRDKNHPSIIMWSLGNESFYGRNHAAMYALSKKLDPTRPVHYEGDRKAETADVFSYMYYPLNLLIETATAEGDAFKKPIILCEYAHAMGNGPGALEEYQNAFRKYRRLQGGFIWEWANHGIWQPSQKRYAYGGDFGDEPNDGSFVLDGLCFSDHTPTPGLTELKKVFAPVRISRELYNLIIMNDYDFSDLNHIEAKWELRSYSSRPKLRGQQHVLSSGVLDLPTIAAASLAKIDISQLINQYHRDGDDQVWFSVSFCLKKGYYEIWALPNHEIAFFQSKVSEERPLKQPANLPSSLLPTPSTSKSQNSITITAGSSTLTFCRNTGHLSTWTHESTPLISHCNGPQLSIWRAPTDNDLGSDAKIWKRWGLDKMIHNNRSMTVAEGDSGCVEVITVSSFAPPVLAWHFEVTTVHTIVANGAIQIRVQVKPYGDFPPTIPRLGLICMLSAGFEDVTWFGKGPGETYIDSCTGQKIDVWKMKVDEMFTNYEVPQENGNRMDTRWAVLRDGKAGKSVAIRRLPENLVAKEAVAVPAAAAGGRPERVHENEDKREEDQVEDDPNQMFSFNASHYTAEDLERAMHAGPELEKYKREAVVLRMDAAHHGLGTGSCGPGVLEKYRLKVEEEGWRFGYEMKIFDEDGK